MNAGNPGAKANIADVSAPLLATPLLMAVQLRAINKPMSFQLLEWRA
jgi:hypothetical protein